MIFAILDKINLGISFILVVITSAISPENCILRSNPIHGAAESRQVDSELLGKSATLRKLFVTTPFFYWSAILGKNHPKSRSCLAEETKKMKKHSYMYIKEDEGYSKGPFYPRHLWLLCWHQITFNIFLPWFIEFLIYKAVTLRKAFSRKGDISLFSTKAFCSERNTRNKSFSPSWACMKIFFVVVNNWTIYEKTFWSNVK